MNKNIIEENKITPKNVSEHQYIFNIKNDELLDAIDGKSKIYKNRELKNVIDSLEEIISSKSDNDINIDYADIECILECTSQS